LGRAKPSSPGQESRKGKRKGLGLHYLQGLGRDLEDGEDWEDLPLDYIS
jgi:hypothetical protein